MHNVSVLASRTSPRLKCVLDWLLTEQLGLSYKIVHRAGEVKEGTFCIAYGTDHPGALYIPDEGLLWEQCTMQNAQCIIPPHRIDIPTDQLIDQSTNQLSFDILGSIFYLLSRYEEYLPYTPDKHGRYPATESVLYKSGLLERPIVDEWVHQLRMMLKNDFQLDVREPSFSMLPTYDIDIAWSYKNKGWRRNAGASAKSLMKGKLRVVAQRGRVLVGKAKDPYDSFDWIKVLHQYLNVQPIYFILAALQTTDFDKNISPEHPAMQSLIRDLQQQGQIGMHPSYFTQKDDGMFNAEKQALESITGKKIILSRQHYIKLHLPETYYQLMANNILDDYSMGYGTHLGFRAGTGQAFFWYDLLNERQTSLRVHPFCFMDTTAHFDQKLSAAAAFERLDAMAQKIKACRSRLITVFHNFSLGSDAEWKGWSEGYQKFLEGVKS